jgi:tRNA dimethylallyltransferase
MFYYSFSKPLVVIVGPTAVGKTQISIQLAERFEGEIVSADSRLLYRGMDIGTAKPSLADRQRVPHHLIDIVNPDQVWSLALYQRAAYQAINDIHARGKLPFLVGGTGQYIRSIIQGWEIPSQHPNDQMREILEAWGNKIGPRELHRRLMQIDPQAGSKIEPMNLRRTIRALEVIFSTGEKFSEQKRKEGTNFGLLIVGLIIPREALYRRIDERIKGMLNGGLIDEVRSLLNQGFSKDLPTFSAIGYRQVIEYLNGQISIDEAEMEMKRLTRQFVRRQANWFKQDDPSIHWFDVSEVVVDAIGDYIESPTGWITPAV